MERHLGSWTGKGFEADVTLCDEIQRLTGVSASTASLAQVDVLKHYGIKRFGLAYLRRRADPQNHRDLRPPGVHDRQIRSAQ